MNRLKAMRVIAWLLVATGVTFGLFTIVFGIVGPDQEIHAVHNAVVASLLLVLTAPPMIAVARDPGGAIRPLVILVVLAVAGLAAMALALTPDPFILPVLITVTEEIEECQREGSRAGSELEPAVASTVDAIRDQRNMVGVVHPAAP